MTSNQMSRTESPTNTNQILSSDPDGDIIDGLFVGQAQFLILENTLKTDLFEHIEEEPSPVTVATLSTKHGYHPDILERLLDNLACMKLVHKSGGETSGKWKYSNTRAASVYLTRQSEFYKGDVLNVDKTLVEKTSSSLVDTLKMGPVNQMKNFMESGNLNENRKMNELVKEAKSHATKNMTSFNDNATKSVTSCNHNAKVDNIKATTAKVRPTNINENGNTEKGNTENSNTEKNNTASTGTISTAFTKCPQNGTGASVKVLSKSMDAMLYSCRHVIPKTFDLSGHRQAVDLGGGTGYLARLLTDYYPQLSTIVFELPPVAAMGRASYDSDSGAHNDGRVSFVEGDFFQDELPQADLYILSHVLHAWNQTNIDRLLAKTFTTLPPGGKLLILEKFLNDKKDGPSYIMNIYLNLSSIGEGRERTAEEYKQLVESHGFTDTRYKTIQGINLYDALLTCKPF